MSCVSQKKQKKKRRTIDFKAVGFAKTEDMPMFENKANGEYRMSKGKLENESRRCCWV